MLDLDLSPVRSRSVQLFIPMFHTNMEDGNDPALKSYEFILTHHLDITWMDVVCIFGDRKYAVDAMDEFTRIDSAWDLPNLLL